METSMNSLKVMVVDDQNSACRLIKELVAGLLPSAHVETFNDPEEALIWARSESPALSIIDYRMPYLDGEQFVKKLRSFEDVGEASTVVIATAIGDRSIDEQAIAAGANHVIRKPVQPEELKAMITRAIHSSSTPEMLQSAGNS